MAETKQTDYGSIRVGGYVILNDKPCVIKSIQLSKTGKHGSMKCRIEAVSLIDEQKIIEVHPSGDNVLIPIIGKKNAQVLSISGKKANVMDMETYETFDLEIPEEDKNNIQEGSQIIYWIIMDQKVFKQAK